MRDDYEGRHRVVRPYMDLEPEPPTEPIPAVGRVLEPRGRHSAGRARAYVHHDDGLDDLRAALADPIRRLAAVRPDIAHQVPPRGSEGRLAGVK